MVGRFVAYWNRQRKEEKSHHLSEYLSASVYLHGLAGDIAAAREGMESLIATDLLKYLPQAFRNVLNS
jgi:NAD(P)H-hydrate epimerase